MASDSIFWARDPVSSLAKVLVREQLAIREDPCHVEADFVKDLGMD